MNYHISVPLVSVVRLKKFLLILTVASFRCYHLECGSEAADDSCGQVKEFVHFKV